MQRLALILLAFLAAAPVRGSDDPLAAYAVVAIRPATTTVFMANVSMAMPPFVRKGGLYLSTYTVKVFPYFLFNEKGRIWIQVSEADLRRVARGEPIDFVGKAVSDSGAVRRVEGRASPNGPFTGTIRVKVVVSRRIVLSYATSYSLEGPGAPAATPR